MFWVMDSVHGRVVVVAGDDSRLAAAAAAALTVGARVAVVSRTLDGTTSATVRFNADARDPDAWERIAMHIEQHLGPVDGVITDDSARAVVDGVFATDLARRGRAPVHVLDDEEAPAVVTRLVGTPPATPSPPATAAPDP